jgi:hypothetical protein
MGETLSMSATSRCAIAAVIVLAVLTAARSDDTVSAKTMGEFLGYVVMCECLPYESSHQQAAFYALLVEEQGRTYADVADSHMRFTLGGDYRNTEAFCSVHICPSDAALYYGEVLSMIDVETEPEAFRLDYQRHLEASLPSAEAESEVPLRSFCMWRPVGRGCEGVSAPRKRLSRRPGPRPRPRGPG